MNRQKLPSDRDFFLEYDHGNTECYLFGTGEIESIRRDNWFGDHGGRDGGGEDRCGEEDQKR